VPPSLDFPVLIFDLDSMPFLFYDVLTLRSHISHDHGSKTNSITKSAKASKRVHDTTQTPMISTNNINTTQENFMMMPLNYLTNSPKKRVQFAPIVTTCTVLSLPPEDMDDLWYTSTEISTFRRQAGSLASSLGKEEGLPKNALYCDMPRGLEHCTPERRKYRCLTIKCTLSASRSAIGAEKTAMIARKCTAWNENAAFVQACRDYAEIYEPQMLSLIPTVGLPPKFPFPMKKRCCASAGDGSRRRVRRRTSLE